MPSTSHTNFRLRGIPLAYEKKEGIRELIKETLDLDPTTTINIHSVAISPSSQDSRTATLSFPDIPACLLDRSRNEWTFHLKDGEDLDLSSSIVFDTHFRGFTPFQRSNHDDCHVDIVAVTGLGGHGLGSFKQKDGPFMWLRDGLPVDEPNLRILSYGYDSKIVDSNSFQNLTDLARSFQLDLESIQNSGHSRPIVFIAHSLGGLLVKETIVQMTHEPERSLLDLISGFMFFGVPHQGLAVECLVPLINDAPNRALLESLGKNSPLLCRLEREFRSAIGTRRRQIVSFYETERSLTAQQVEGGKWQLSGPSEVLVEVSSATCGSLRQHPINRNHSEMVKFSSRQDDLYQRVLQALKPLLEDSRSLQTQVGYNTKISLSEDEKSCLRSLSFQEQDHRYAELHYDKNTCGWLLEDSRYRAWLKAPRGLFWIKGSPGTGKSVLMKFAAEAMQRRYSNDLVVSFFIHGRGASLQRTLLGVYRALLSSLLEKFPTYLQGLTQRFRRQEERFGAYERKDGWAWTESELKECLSEVLSQGTVKQPVTIYLDALDECGEDDAKRLLQYLRKIMSTVDKEEGLLKVCFSSRHYPVLGFETMPTLLVEERNTEDIKCYQIERYILSEAQGVFQWAILVTDIILNEVLSGSNSASLHQAIIAIPKDLQKIYDFILSGAEGEGRAYMVKLFRWVLFSERPLSAHELREALSTSQDMTCTTTSELRAHPCYSDTVSDFEIRVRHISRGLVEFKSREVWEVYQTDGEDWDREAQFIHQSAADFVLQVFLTREPAAESIHGMAYFEISRSCLKYMVLEDILGSSQLSRRELSVKFPLLPYAVTYLLQHILSVERSSMKQADLLELVQWHQPGCLILLSNIWLKMDPDYSHAPMGWPFVGATAPHILVGLGSFSALQIYLNHHTIDFNARDSYGNSPLLLALREGREDLALLLLNQSVALQAGQRPCVRDAPQIDQLGESSDHLIHVNMTNSDGETPLGMAVSMKAHNAILSLLSAGANPKTEPELLLYAISRVDKPLVSDLMERQVCTDGAVFLIVQTLRKRVQNDPDTAQNDPDTALHEILVSLLEAGVNTGSLPGVAEESIIEDSEDSSDEIEHDEALRLALYHDLMPVATLLILHAAFAATTDLDVFYLLEIAAHHNEMDILDALPIKFCPQRESFTETKLFVRHDAVRRNETGVDTVFLRTLYADGVPSDILLHSVLRTYV
ncbi:hypothetical protein FIE12Z_10749 [Fusarium flagelliforme]|uniref:Nephrocystin 3-like N-terminal domain-containing protein n=1 Tax=Fusarium flagelliforme TaxID=2675880 RepID=A0A395MAY2_9HYPO|nr:hypothetical protein FIE12Z_10749 [Fusarium flagelliforme]